MSSDSDNYVERKILPISVKEAKNRLRKLKPLLKQMMNDVQEYLKVENLLRQTSRSEDLESISKLRFELDQIEERLMNLQHLFLDYDCVIKDMKTGLIDFIAMRGEQPVWLCYKEGEKDIVYYHHWNAGFVGRQPIDFE